MRPREHLRLLREAELEQDCEAAREEWRSSGDAAAWERTLGDGLDDPRG